MKKIIFGMLFLGAMVFAQNINQDRGYFGSIGIGASFLPTEVENQGSFTKYSGIGVQFDLRVGALVKKDWTVTLDVLETVMLGPDKNETTPTSDVLSQTMIGPGVTWYFDKKELMYLSGSLGLTHFRFMNSDIHFWDKSRLGFGGAVRIGKDWRMNPGSLLGLELYGSYSSASVNISNHVATYRSGKIGMLMNVKVGSRCVLSPSETQKYRDCMKGF